MRRAILMVLLLSCVLSLFACKLVDKLTKKDSSAASSSASSTSGYSSSGSIGVSECDDYIRAYKRCLSDKIPAEERATFESALEQNVSIWRQYAASPERRAGLAEACQEASDTTANSLQAYGCSF